MTFGFRWADTFKRPSCNGRKHTVIVRNMQNNSGRLPIWWLGGAPHGVPRAAQPDILSITGKVTSEETAVFYTGSHVYRISRGAKATRSYRGPRLPGRGGYECRRIPRACRAAHRRARAFRSRLEHPTGAYARASLARIADCANLHQPHGRLYHHASARHRQLPAAGRIHAARRPVLSGGRSAYRHLLHQPRARRGPQAD